MILEHSIRVTFEEKEPKDKYNSCKHRAEQDVDPYPGWNYACTLVDLKIKETRTE
jgi:hypothetical protein